MVPLARPRSSLTGGNRTEEAVPEYCFVRGSEPDPPAPCATAPTLYPALCAVRGGEF
jgi:hypothetical protein